MSKRYVATINTPGYLPTDDDPPVFDTAREAWEYLESEFRGSMETLAFYTEIQMAVADEFIRFQTAGAIGSVFTTTPGYDGDHDLGLSYSVSEVEE